MIFYYDITVNVTDTTCTEGIPKFYRTNVTGICESVDCGDNLVAGYELGIENCKKHAVNKCLSEFNEDVRDNYRAVASKINYVTKLH